MTVYTSRHKLWNATNTQEKIDAMFNAKARAKFWSLVDDSPEHGGCWRFKRLHALGYGTLSVGGFHHRAHRAAWLITHGPIPADLHILHSCDHPWCVNPAHLRVGTIQENYQQRDAQLKCTKGEKHHTAKLKDEQVLEIYLSKEPRSELARRFGVYPTTIWKIQEGITWKHLTTHRPHA